MVTSSTSFSLPHFPSNSNCRLLNPSNENQFHHPFFPQQITRRRPLKSMSTTKASRETSIPARDRVIDFGKYKGKMLGTLPATYLQWISNNLRARDFEEWAKLADQVLQDPVYKDRLEWESAEKVLNGDVLRSGDSSKSASSSKQQSPVSDLLEISERFGWDNEDKVGWRKVDFELLGTSKGGRIPRVGAEQKKERELRSLEGLDEGNDLIMNRKGGIRRGGGDIEAVKEEVDTVRGSRGERRERLRLKRSGSGRINKFSMNGLRSGESEESDRDGDLREELNNPFPGREALIRKALRGKRGLL